MYASVSLTKNNYIVEVNQITCDEVKVQNCFQCTLKDLTACFDTIRDGLVTDKFCNHRFQKMLSWDDLLLVVNDDSLDDSRECRSMHFNVLRHLGVPELLAWDSYHLKQRHLFHGRLR